MKFHDIPEDVEPMDFSQILTTWVIVNLKRADWDYLIIVAPMNQQGHFYVVVQSTRAVAKSHPIILKRNEILTNVILNTQQDRTFLLNESRPGAKQHYNGCSKADIMTAFVETNSEV